MKKATKFVALFLALALSLSTLTLLTACGGDSADNDPPAVSNQPSDTPDPAPSETPDPVESEEPEETEDIPPAEANPFAGEYDIALVNPEGDTIYLQEFVVNEDGTLVGVGDASGMSNFEGIVNEDGTFTGEFTRLGGTLEGSIDADGNVTGTGEIRGRNYTFEGTKY